MRSTLTAIAVRTCWTSALPWSRYRVWRMLWPWTNSLMGLSTPERRAQLDFHSAVLRSARASAWILLSSCGGNVRLLDLPRVHYTLSGQGQHWRSVNVATM
jgi:hypothetical protein